MELNTPTPAPSETAAPAPAPKEKASYGAVIALMLILGIIVVGALYLWGQRLETESPAPAAGTVEEGAELDAGVNVEVQ
jgi:hypothetical protein